MKIVADENMPFAPEAFGTLGEVTTVPGRGMTREMLGGADILAVRSVTPVGPDLLEGTGVRFVGTATIGTDHVDQAYLRERGIGFASAPGCNAVSVAEYVVAALLVLAKRGGYRLAGRTLGVIGVGNVGTQVAARAEALGLRVLRNDPPLARQTGSSVYRPLDEVLRADILTLHVPLTREGPDATYHLVDADFLARMRPGGVLLNTSRGSVVDGRALAAALDRGDLGAAVLDVWEDEPAIETSLLERVAIGTPHIAGYSFDGKVRGTTMILEAACRHFGRPCTWDPSAVMPAGPCPELTLDAAGRDDETVLREAVLSVYDILADDGRLRETAERIKRKPKKGTQLFSSEKEAVSLFPTSSKKRAASPFSAAFDRLRRDYPVRREFAATRLTLTGARDSFRAKAAALGFRLQ